MDRHKDVGFGALFLWSILYAVILPVVAYSTVVYGLAVQGAWIRELMAAMFGLGGFALAVSRAG